MGSLQMDQRWRIRSRNTNFCSFPVEVRGSDSNSTERGTLSCQSAQVPHAQIARMEAADSKGLLGVVGHAKSASPRAKNASPHYVVWKIALSALPKTQRREGLKDEESPGYTQ
jgi:hypothetical protein